LQRRFSGNKAPSIEHEPLSTLRLMRNTHARSHLQLLNNIRRSKERDKRKRSGAKAAAAASAAMDEGDDMGDEEGAAWGVGGAAASRSLAHKPSYEELL
jgi:hypothetical protein